MKVHADCCVTRLLGICVSHADPCSLLVMYYLNCLNVHFVLV